jgi:outer membrane protein assembly factor BamB
MLPDNLKSHYLFDAMTILVMLIAHSLLLGNLPANAAGNWPQFRGPQASGVADSDAPLTWNLDTGDNVRWQTPVPGLAHASPILWEGKIYLTTAVRPGAKPDLKIGLYGDGKSYTEKEPHQWRLLCLDQATGRTLWDKLAHESVPRLERHTKATHCNSTPATDGQRIVAMFGSEGLFCFDLGGRPLWRKDLGKLHAGPYDHPSMQWGFASSPVLQDGKVVVQCDTLSEQFLAVFDAADGRELWRTPRSEVTAWSTPIIATNPDRKQIIVNGWKQIGGYDFNTGRELWRLNGGGDIPVASPILAGDFVILTSGHGKYRPMRAVRLTATGDITPPEMGATNQFVAWCHPRKGNYLQTPIAVGDLLWGCLDNGVVTCFDWKTGQLHYEERLGSGSQGFSASPVAAGRHLYFTGEQGDVFVLAATNRFTVLATNKLGGISLSTPAVSDGALYVRTTEKMLALGPKPKERAARQ